MRSRDLSCWTYPIPNDAGSSGRGELFARRVTFAVLFVATMAASLWLAALALAPGGFGVLDIAALVLFAVTLPWMVAGFWNAVIGFIIMRFAADPATAVMPSTARSRRRARDGVDGDPVVRS